MVHPIRYSAVLSGVFDALRLFRSVIIVTSWLCFLILARIDGPILLGRQIAVYSNGNVNFMHITVTTGFVRVLACLVKKTAALDPRQTTVIRRRVIWL